MLAEYSNQRENIQSVANLSDRVPAHPEVDVLQVGDSVELSWPAVAECFEDLPCTDLEIAEYSVKLSEVDAPRGFDDDGFTNGDSRFFESHFLAEAICKEGLCAVTVSSDFFLDGDLYEWEVFAIEKSGNSTYRSSEFTYAAAVPEPTSIARGWFALVAGMIWVRPRRS